MNNNCFRPQHDKCKDKIYVIGTPGPRGRDGAGTITVGSTTTGEPGTNASVTNSGTAQNAILNFTIPRGETGAQGPQGETGAQGPQGETGATGEQGPAGEAATITVGSTTTGEPGTNASVTNSGTAQNAILNFTIPRGETGAQGPQGETGAQGPQGETGATGEQGPAGEAATITIGSTTTGEPGTNASVTNSGTAQNAILNFTIPRGETGAQGPQGETGATGEQGPAGEVATNEYGYKYDTTNDTITLTANTVSTVPLAQTGPLNAITGGTTNALTIGSTGTYKIDYFFNGISNTEGNVTLAVYNNSNLVTGSTLTLNLETTDEKSVSGSVIATLSEGDVITLGLEATTGVEVTPASNTNAYLSIVKLA